LALQIVILQELVIFINLHELSISDAISLIAHFLQICIIKSGNTSEINNIAVLYSLTYGDKIANPRCSEKIRNRERRTIIEANWSWADLLLPTLGGES
jgi:hypothetical protein